MKKPEMPLAPPVQVARPPPPQSAALVKLARPTPVIKAALLADDDHDRLCDPAALHEPIIGCGDRAHHLALVAGTALARLQPSPKRPAPPLPALRPASRQTCERRCGKAGQCDPSSPYGCGGEFCLGFEGRLY